MKKTKGKVLSLILASALIVSSFSTSLVSAATTRETGSLNGVDDEIYLVSYGKNTPRVSIDAIIGKDGGPSIETYDHDDADSAEFVSYTHASGDRLVSINGDGELYVKKEASGKEVITVTYEADYTRDDKDVTVRASKDITIYADEKGEQFLAKFEEGNDLDARPDDIESAAVNDEELVLGVYTTDAVTPLTDEELNANGSDDELVDYANIKAEYNLDPSFDDSTKAELKNEDSKVFETPDVDGGKITLATKIQLDTLTQDEKDAKVAAAKAELVKAYDALNSAVKTFDLSDDTVDYTTATGAYDTAKDTYDTTKNDTNLTALLAAGDAVKTAVAAQEDESIVAKVAAATTKKEAVDTAEALEVDTKEGTAKFATTGSETLKVKLNDDSKATDFKISVDKKYRVDYTAEVNKKASTTYITREGKTWDDDDSSTTIKNEKAWAITNYDIVVEEGGKLTVTNGKIGDITGKGDITVDGGTVGDIKANAISVDGGSVGTLKIASIKDGNDNDVYGGIAVTDGKVKAIDADKADVDISGGVISGNVVGSTVSIDSDDEDVPTTINGNVTAKNGDKTIDVSSSSDADVAVTGTLKGEVTLNDEVTVGAIDADYQYNVTFDNFTGKFTGDTGLKNTKGVTITLNGDSEVAVKGKVVADTVSIEDGSKLTVEEATFGTVEEEGTLAVPAGKLFIEDSLTDTTIQLTSGLVAGATAFESYTDAVDPDDFVTLGYTVEQKTVNDDVDKFVIKTVTFAGLSFDKTEVSVAKGYEDKITLSNYPDGTALPEGAQIEWAIDGNDDYITLTVEGNVGTVKVLDYNADYATDNQATITATVVDEDGYAYDDYVVATTKVTGTALPASTLTLDTKSASVGVGGLYQFLAKSSSGAVITAVSSDEQIATVTPYDLLDPRGAKFSVNGVKEGKATITATDANGATASFEVTVVKVNGTLKADTTSYKFAPGNIYDVKFTVTGTNAVPVVTANGKVVSVVSRGNGVYRVTALTPGTAWVQATVGNARVSITFVVENGATAGGVRGNNVSNL